MGIPACLAQDCEFFTLVLHPPVSARWCSCETFLYRRTEGIKIRENASRILSPTTYTCTFCLQIRSPIIPCFCLLCYAYHCNAIRTEMDSFAWCLFIITKSLKSLLSDNTGRQWLAFSETDEYYADCKLYREQQRKMWCFTLKPSHVFRAFVWLSVFTAEYT